MTTLFPGALDNFTDPSGTAMLGATTPKHSEHHANINDAIEAIETTIGETGSTDPASVEKRLVDVIDAAASAAAAISAHEVAGDPHPGYALESALGTAATLNVGTGALNIVQLDGSAKLPPVDGSQLTGVLGSGGVTGGNAHDHTGGAGAQIAYSTLSGLPTLGSAAAAATGDFEAAGAVSTHNAVTTAHGISAFGATLVDDVDAATARTTLDLGNVDNTSDASKPVSTAQQTALNLKADLASPTFTGTVGGITAAMVGAPSGSGTSTGTNTGDSATPAETTATIGTLINGATSKTTPVDADKFSIWDSVSGLLQAVTWANIKTALNSLFVQLSGGAGTQNLGGKLGIGIAPTAVLHLKAGTASANTAPLKFASGTNLTTPEAGVVEYDGSGLYITDSAPSRQRIATREYVLSSNGNLITNGYGSIGNNTNFSGYQYTKTDIAAGFGSFLVNLANGFRTSDEQIPVDPAYAYVLSMYLKAGDVGGANFNPTAKQYIGVALYDIDNNEIYSSHSGKVSGATDTTLAAQLNPGDTFVSLTDATGWSNGATLTNNHFCWYGYANSNGYIYPDYTYTRNLSSTYSSVSLGTWVSGGISGNTITLRVAWTGPTLAAGTAVRNNGNTAGTYKYIIAANVSLTNAWVKYSGVIAGLSNVGLESTYVFRAGTAYMRIMHYVNYLGAADNNVRLSAVHLTKVSAANLEPNIGIGASYKALLQSQLPTNGLAVEGKAGFGTSSPSAQVHVMSTTEQVRASYDAANYEASTTSSAGKTTKALVGTAPDIKWSVSDATTNALYDLATFSKNSTGAGAAGLGARINLAAKSSTTTDTLQGALSASWVDATHATRKASTRLWAADSTGLREGIRLEADGTQVLLGFYGGNAVAKPTALTATVAAAPAGGTGTAAGGWDTSGNRDLAIATINNLKTRVDQLETKLQALGLLT